MAGLPPKKKSVTKQTRLVLKGGAISLQRLLTLASKQGHDPKKVTVTLEQEYNVAAAEMDDPILVVYMNK